MPKEILLHVIFPMLGGEEAYKEKQNHCRELDVLPEFRSKVFLNIQEHSCVHVFEGEKRLHGV